MSVKVTNSLNVLLGSHPDVGGASIGYIDNYEVSSVNVGYARVSSGEVMTENHFMECASLSKTVAAAFSIEYFTSRRIPMTTSVNKLLGDAGSKWKLSLPPGHERSSLNSDWIDEITLAMLVNHTALGMHYVFGVPLSDEFPSAEELLNGTHEETYGYAPLYVERKPGAEFKYSGGGFIVLQHLLESREGKTIDTLMRPFLEKCGIADEFSFNLTLGDDVKVAYGHLTRTSEVAPEDGGRLSFPPLAAGGLCTSRALATFLSHLAKAYDASPGTGDLPISPNTARLMLGPEALVNLGAYDFMRSKAGLGVFVAEAGPNRIMLHQAANEGFRGVYMLCFSGPDRGRGFVLLCNGDNPAVYFQCEAAKLLLGKDGLDIEGIDFSREKTFDMKGLKQEQIVNLGLKELVLACFTTIAIDGPKELVSKL